MAKRFTSRQKKRRTLAGHPMAHDRIGKRPVKLAVADQKQRIRETGRRRGGG